MLGNGTGRPSRAKVTAVAAYQPAGVAGQKLAHLPGSRQGRVRQLCPGSSDVDFLRDLKRIVDLDAQIAHSAFDLGMAEEELDGSQVAGAPVDQRASVRRMEWAAYLSGSRPMPLTHSETKRAYCRVVRWSSGPRCPLNKHSPDFRALYCRYAPSGVSR